MFMPQVDAQPSSTLRCWIAACVLFVGGICANSANAQSNLIVESDDWSFDGRVVPRKFNLLTLAVRNISNKPFDGVITLVRNSNGRRVGANMSEAVSIGPQGKRIVQFYPYVGTQVDEFEVVWGGGAKDRHTTEQPMLSAGARVLLNNPLMSGGFSLSLHSFNEEYFPPSVIGTDSLRAVVLNHLPRWQGAQREAFRDWLHKGGQLHMLLGSDNKFPESSIPELNGSQPTSFGNGRVFWHPFGSDGFDRSFVNDVVYKHSQPAVALMTHANESVDTDPTLPNSVRTAYIPSDWTGAEEISLRMKDLIPVKHNWGLIFLMSFVYVAIVFPGGWVLSRKVTDYRINLAALLGLVALMSMLFSSVGARGFGELTTTHTLAIATPLPDGFWSTEQFHSVFVIDGDRYTLEQNSETAAYSAIQNDEAVNGMIDSGRNAKFNVDIPPFTFRSFVGRARVKLSPAAFAIKSISFNSAAQLDSLVLTQTGALPTSPISAVVLFGETAYEVNVSKLNSEINVIMTHRGPIGSFVPELSWNNYRQDYQNESQGYGELRGWLVAYELGLHRMVDVAAYNHPKNRLSLLVYAELPNELRTLHTKDQVQEPMGVQKGKVLYRFDLDVPEDVQTTQ